MTEIEYLLVSMMEECAEIQQSVAKILRFGPTDRYPHDSSVTTLEKLQAEMVDLIALVELLEAEGIEVRKMDMSMIEGIAAKKKKVAKYMAYARSVGTLQLDRGNENDRFRDLMRSVSEFMHVTRFMTVSGTGVEGGSSAKIDKLLQELHRKWRVYMFDRPALFDRPEGSDSEDPGQAGDSVSGDGGSDSARVP